jgi:hypothetical protein
MSRLLNANALGFLRSTEAAAIVAALFRGRGIENERKKYAGKGDSSEGPRKAFSLPRDAILERAVDRMKPYFKSAFGAGKIKFWDVLEPARAQTATTSHEDYWDELAKGFGDDSIPGPRGGPGLEAVVLPVDGMRALRQGLEGGSISALLLGEAGAFADDSDSGPVGPLHYLVTVLDRSTSAALRHNPFPESNSTLFEDRTPMTVERAARDIILPKLQYLAAARMHKTEITISTVFDDSDQTLHRAIRERFRVHCSHGSSVAPAAAVCAGRHGVDCFLCVVRRTHAVAIAAIANAHGYEFRALPVAANRETILDARFLDARTFISPDRDYLVIATGISENPILQGVRFRGDDLATTQSLIIRRMTRSSRMIRTTHHLKHRQFLMPSGETTGYQAISEEIQKFLRDCVVDLPGTRPPPAPRRHDQA